MAWQGWLKGLGFMQACLFLVCVGFLHALLFLCTFFFLLQRAG